MPDEKAVEALIRALDEQAAILTRVLAEQGGNMSERDRHRFRKVAVGALRRAENLPRLVASEPAVDWVDANMRFLPAISRVVNNYLEQR
jgi:hypothetical protein